LTTLKTGANLYSTNCPGMEDWFIKSYSGKWEWNTERTRCGYL